MPIKNDYNWMNNKRKSVDGDIEFSEIQAECATLQCNEEASPSFHVFVQNTRCANL